MNAAIPHITVLPPGPERRELHFDQNHVIKSYPVHSEYKGAGEVKSTGIDFADFARMQTSEHKLAPHRRSEPPAWALNEQLMAKVVTRYLEMRAGIRKPQRVPLLARIHNAEEALHTQRPELQARLERMCREYVAAKKENNAPRAKVLQLQIKNIDSILVSTEQGFAHKVVGIIFYYFRCGLDSVNVGERLGLTPPAVRQTIWRLNRTWERLGKEKDLPLEPPKIVLDVAVARSEGAKFGEIAARFGISTTAAFQYVKKARLAGIRIDDYVAYIHFAARVEVNPLPYEQWRMLEPQCTPRKLQKHQTAVAR